MFGFGNRKLLVCCSAFVVLVNTMMGVSGSQMSSDVKDALLKGLDAGKKIHVALTKDKLSEALTKVNDNLVPYLGSFKPMTDMILGKISDAEATSMTLQYVLVNNDLDTLPIDFTRLVKMIAWSQASGNFEGSERSITDTAYKLNRFLRSESDQVQTAKDAFLESYKYKYSSALDTLYDEAFRDDLVFSRNILDAVVIQTEKNLGKYETFARGVIQLLLQAVKVKMTAYHLYGHATQDVQKEWVDKLQALSGKMKKIGQDVKTGYLQQLKVDALKIIDDHYSLSNSRLKEMIFDLVTVKYDWRRWFVAVYDDIYGFDQHTIITCGGYSLLHLHDKNIILASVDKAHKDVFSAEKAQGSLSSLEKDIDKCSFPKENEPARLVVNKISEVFGNTCSDVALVMTVKRGNNLSYSPLGSHVFYHKISKKKRCCTGMWNTLCKTINWDYDVILFS